FFSDSVVLFTISATSINEVLGLPNPPEANLKEKVVEDNGQWLMNTLVVEEKRASTHWSITHTDIKGTHFTTQSRRWLQLVSRPIRHPPMPAM
ncbi:hypothetical protein HAX54_010490, partial [Datura stramonium]|nr:hypothetical protein [Datura stramonium]